MADRKKELPLDHGPGHKDHPEQYPTEEESLFDKFESERHVDPIPMEDAAMERREEKQRDGTSKDQSSSPGKYHSGF
ncbi:hypothetical protein [Paenibacillus ihbetae]|uniref:Uncharacterized protein n=1 Tax=Paenibacillus ihbetae TaxID=1870820 RepID=A0A1B2DZW2_9BACL|nr:hypothetical protein [Paenibacillus ihbetae]ANY73212.1 hypothetical protein BBD41_11790 [Paenibacillus ihbetae]OOC59137.1 hypothetical protein BBD40_26225 [Paenibacillus ihbetae]